MRLRRRWLAAIAALTIWTATAASAQMGATTPTAPAPSAAPAAATTTTAPAPKPTVPATPAPDVPAAAAAATPAAPASAAPAPPAGPAVVAAAPPPTVFTIPTGVPNSPALGVGLRIEGEAFAAQRYAQLLQSVGKQTEANEQLRIMKIRANQAIHKLTEVSASATYKNTPAAPEALYNAALIEYYIQADNFNALTSLRTLDSLYGTHKYPDKAAAKALLNTVWPQVDNYYRTTRFWNVGYQIMVFLVKLTGSQSYSYWLAILFISMIVKAALIPTSNKQYASMRAMQKLQPLISEIQTKYKDDPAKLQQKTWAVYKEHNVNPFGTCTSVLWTIPVMYALWSVIRLFEFQFAKGTFLWIGSPLSHAFPAYLATDLSQPDTPLLLIYAGSMYFQMRMTTPPDPQQAEQQKLMAIYMPAMYAFFFLQARLSSAFVLYYLIFNLLSMGQQAYYMRKRANDGPIIPVKAEPPSDGASRNGHSSAKEATGSSDSESSESDTRSTGSKAASRGPIAPRVHPKKKRR